MPPRKWGVEGREGAPNSKGTASSPLASGVYRPRVRQNSFQPRTSLPGLFPPPRMPPLLCRVNFTFFIFFNCGEIHKTKINHFKVKYSVASGTRTVPCDEHLNRLPLLLHQPQRKSCTCYTLAPAPIVPSPQSLATTHLLPSLCMYLCWTF